MDHHPEGPGLAAAGFNYDRNLIPNIDLTNRVMAPFLIYFEGPLYEYKWHFNIIDKNT